MILTERNMISIRKQNDFIGIKFLSLEWNMFHWSIITSTRRKVFLLEGIGFLYQERFHLNSKLFLSDRNLFPLAGKSSTLPKTCFSRDRKRFPIFIDKYLRGLEIFFFLDFYLLLEFILDFQFIIWISYFFWSYRIWLIFLYLISHVKISKPSKEIPLPTQH